ncbi:hypothetical protein L6E12_07090 [Actinokineospora sp. PR83]|uniref:hypothetical protein n=1 Tax=Actinokineospora sp. PR83 TaxID=2884908 RepID=UPI001F370EB9|nr:hypothetical protein [Actinokineospora sp. PR83]MCG8915547.1 hypothetical protein [Actinokineospora sp. PR83]
MIGEIDRLAAAAATELTLRSRGNRWTHLPLCVVEAVFSINARYGGVVRVCRAHADHFSLIDPLLPAATADEVIGTGREVPVDTLADVGHRLGAERLADEVFRSRGRTSPRGGILKAEAAIRCAQVLVGVGVHRIGDVAGLLADPGRLVDTERRLAEVPGPGAGARLSYLWMLAGDDHRVKAVGGGPRDMAPRVGPGVTDSRARVTCANPNCLWK